jgi:hypothetical protein
MERAGGEEICVIRKGGRWKEDEGMMIIGLIVRERVVLYAHGNKEDK